MGIPSFPVQNFVAVPYIGALQPVTVSLLTTSASMTNDGQIIRPPVQSLTVSTQFDWLGTYTDQAVIVNLQSQNNVSPLNKILMLYIDNSRNPNSISVGFADTQQFIEAPAFTTGYYPVFTGYLYFTVYNGTTGLKPVTAQSYTDIIICNFAVPGFLSLNTLEVAFQNSSGSVVPTLGDQFANASVAVTGTSGSVSVLPLIALPQQYVITAITVSSAGLFIDSTGTPEFMSIELTDGANVISSLTYFMTYSIYAGFQYTPLIQQTGLNIPAQSLTLSFGAAVALPSAGLIQASIIFAELTL